jgi:CrcB protein
MMAVWVLYALVGIGGGLGCMSRFAMARFIGGLIDTPFPLGTLVINITASFLLGVVGSLVAARVAPASEALRVAIGVGFIGGYSTFSTLEYETHSLFETGESLLALLNVFGSVAAGLIAVRLGVLCGRWWLA